MGSSDREKICIVGDDQGCADREEVAGGSTKTMGAEEIDTEVPISEMTPRPDPGRQYVGWAGGVLQVHDGGGGSRATTMEASCGVDDARTGLGDADSDGASLVVEAEFGAESTGSESRADVAPKDESVGMARNQEGKSMLDSRVDEILALLLNLKATASKASGSAVVAESSAGAICSEGGAASDDEIIGSSDLEWEHELWRSGREADQVRFDRNGEAEMALPDVDRPEPVVETARVGMRDLLDFKAALPMGGGDADI